MAVILQLKLISFVVIIFAILVIDFLVITRKRMKIFSRFPIAMIVFLFLLFVSFESSDNSMGRLEFLVIMLVLSGCALFAYFNYVAFIKRGITFSIIMNHAKDPKDRKNDMEFMDINMRLEEMLNSGWIYKDNDGFTLTKQGRFVLKLYKFIVNMLKIDRIG